MTAQNQTYNHNNNKHINTISLLLVDIKTKSTSPYRSQINKTKSFSNFKHRVGKKNTTNANSWPRIHSAPLKTKH